jgi:hypothetical protein
MDIQPARALGIPSFWVNPISGPTDLSTVHTEGSLSDVHNWIEARSENELKLNLPGFTNSIYRMQANTAAIDTILRNAPPGIWDIGHKNENWQINEILCHLRDVDLEVHLPRLAAVRDEDAPFLPAVDADSWAEERDYHSQDGQQAFRDYVEARKKLLEMASGLEKIASKKEIRHSIFGPITLDEILRIAARHDSLHVQQILDEIQVN